MSGKPQIQSSQAEQQVSVKEKLFSNESIKSTLSLPSEAQSSEHTDAYEDREMTKMPFRDIAGKTKQNQQPGSHALNKPKVVRNIDQQVFGQSLDDLQYSQTRSLATQGNAKQGSSTNKQLGDNQESPKQSPQKKVPRGQDFISSLLFENKKLKEENMKMKSKYDELSTKVKSVQREKADLTVTRPAFRPSGKTNTLRSETRQDKMASSSTGDKQTSPSPKSKSKSPTKRTRQQNYPVVQSSLPGQIHYDLSGLKVIDVVPEPDSCLINHELKQYERDNAHRYVPRNLSRKNIDMQQKIDEDIQ